MAEAEGEVVDSRPEPLQAAPPDPTPVQVLQGQVGVPGVHATQTTHPASPVTSIGDLAVQLGTVLTVMVVPGGTLNLQDLATIEILQQLKKTLIERLTHSTVVHMTHYTEWKKYKLTN